MSDDPDTTAQPEAAAAPETAQETAPPESAEAAEDAAWQEMLAEEYGEGEPAKEEGTTDEETPAEPAQEASGAEEAGKDGEEAADATEGNPESEEAAAAIDWGNAPEELRSAFEAEKARADAAEQGKRSAEGRVAAAQRRLDTLIAGEGKTKPAPAKPSQQTQEEPVHSKEAEEALKTFETDYPEVAKPILQHVVSPLTRMMQSQAAEIASLKTALSQVGDERLEAATVAQEQMVIEAHPDFAEIVSDKALAEWANAQPAYVQDLYDRNVDSIVDGAGVVDLINRFKADKGLANGANGNGTAAGEENPGARKPAADPSREIRLRSARGTPAPSPGATAREQTNADTETEEAVWAELEQAEKRKLAAEARA